MLYDRLQTLPAHADPWIVDHDPIIIKPDARGRIRPADIADITARTASWLREHGVRPGTRAVVWLESSTDVFIAYTAITAIDAVPILVSSTLQPDIVGPMLRGVDGICAAIGVGDRLTGLRELLPEAHVIDWADAAAQAPGQVRLQRPPEIASRQPYVIVHTSGTTNVPKLVECSSRSIDFNAAFQGTVHAMSRMSGLLGLALSPVHGRTVVGMLAGLMRKAPFLLIDHHDPDAVQRTCTEHRPTYLETHPNTFRAWQHLGPTGAFTSVRYFGSGFDVIHPDTVRLLLEASGHRLAMFFEVYGQNESGAISVRTHVKGMLRERQTLGGHLTGPVIPLRRVKILDEAGVPCPPGKPGRIVVRSRGVCNGYLGRRDIVSRDYPQGRWWDTGDWGSLSRTRTLTLVDRASETLRGAPSALAIEDWLLGHFPDFLELVVLEHHDRMWPVVSLRSGARFEDAAWHRAIGDLPPLERPIVVDDATIPRTVTGKVRRKSLSEQLQDRFEAAGGSRA